MTMNFSNLEQSIEENKTDIQLNSYCQKINNFMFL